MQPRSLFSDPLFQFFLAAAAIFGVYAVLEQKSANPVRLDANVRQALIDNFEGITAREARPSEIEKLERDYIIDELLFREAISRGMHLTDGQTKKHLTDNLRRFYAGSPPEPSSADLVNFYAENIEDYRGEPNISFRQVFFDDPPDNPGAILTMLKAGSTVEGDPYWMGNDFPGYGDSMVRGVFGRKFLEALVDLPLGEWSGPITSERGMHFIFKSSRGEAALIPYEAIQDQVAQDYWAMQTQVNIDRAVEELKETYDVVITEAP